MNTSKKEKAILRKFVEIAHRGASGLAPENTLSAFRKAVEIGVDAVELDVHKTNDGKIIVCHDDRLDRTTNMNGLIRDLDLSEISKADAGSWFDEKFTGEEIPTLKKSLELMKDSVITVVEVKDDDISAEVVNSIEETDSVDRVVVISFHDNVLSEMRQINPYIPTGLLIGGIKRNSSKKRAEKFIRRTLEVGATTLNVSHSLVTREFAYEVRRRGVNLWTWTVDDVDIMSKLLDYGVCGITSNYPNRFDGINA